jgi:hypothetical protein
MPGVMGTKTPGTDPVPPPPSGGNLLLVAVAAYRPPLCGVDASDAEVDGWSRELTNGGFAVAHNSKFVEGPVALSS